MATDEQIRQRLEREAALERGDIDFFEYSRRAFVSEYGFDPVPEVQAQPAVSPPAQPTAPPPAQPTAPPPAQPTAPLEPSASEMPEQIPLPSDEDEWTEPADVEKRFIGQVVKKTRREELVSLREASDKAHDLLQKEKAEGSLRNLVGESFFTRLREAFLPRAVPVIQEDDFAHVAWAASQMGQSWTSSMAPGMPRLTTPTEQYVQRKIAEAATGKQFVVTGESQLEWLLRLMMLPQAAIEEAAFQTGFNDIATTPSGKALQAAGMTPEQARVFVGQVGQAQSGAVGKLPLELYTRLLGIPDSDPVKRGYDVIDSYSPSQKYVYTVLDKVRKGRGLSDDVWDATGNINPVLRRAIYAGALTAEILMPWEAPFMKGLSAAGKAAQAARFYMAMEPNPAVGRRLGAAVQGVMSQLPGRSVSAPRVMKKRVATELWNGSLRWDDLPEGLRREMAVVSKVEFEEDLFDTFSNANPRHAVLGAKRAAPSVARPSVARPKVGREKVDAPDDFEKLKAEQPEAKDVPEPERVEEPEVPPPAPAEDVDQLFDQALAFSQRLELDQAAKAMEKFVERVPEDAEARMMLANIYLAGGKYDKAEQALDVVEHIATKLDQAEQYRYSERVRSLRTLVQSQDAPAAKEKLVGGLAFKSTVDEDFAREAMPRVARSDEPLRAKPDVEDLFDKGPQPEVQRDWRKALGKTANAAQLRSFMDEVPPDFAYTATEMSEELVRAFEFLYENPQLKTENAAYELTGVLLEPAFRSSDIAMKRIAKRAKQAAEAPAPQASVEPLDMLNMSSIEGFEAAAEGSFRTGVTGAGNPTDRPLRAILINPNGLAFYRIDTSNPNAVQYGKLGKTQRHAKALKKYEGKSVPADEVDELFDELERYSGTKSNPSWRKSWGDSRDALLAKIRNLIGPEKNYRFQKLDDAPAPRPAPRPAPVEEVVEDVPRVARPDLGMKTEVVDGLTTERVARPKMSFKPTPPPPRRGEAVDRPLTDAPPRRGETVERPVADAPPRRGETVERPLTGVMPRVGEAVERPVTDAPPRRGETVERPLAGVAPPRQSPPTQDPRKTSARKVVDAKTATDDFIKRMEQQPEQLAQEIADAAWEASTGHATKYPANLDEFMSRPEVARFLDVFEKGTERYMRKFGLGPELVNIGSATGSMLESLWVPKARAKQIVRFTGKFMKDYDVRDPKVFDTATGRYSEQASIEIRNWVARTTGKAPEGRVVFGRKTWDAHMSIDDANKAIFQVKQHLAGKLAHVRYAMGTTSAGHMLILDGLNSFKAGKRINRVYASVANTVQSLIDLGINDMPKPAQQVLNNLTNKIRLNGQDLLVRAKEIQNASDSNDALEAVLQVLDASGQGRYDLPSAPVLRELMSAKAAGGPIKDVIAKAATNNEFSGALADVLADGVTPAAADVAVKQIVKTMTDNLLDVLEAAYDGTSRTSLARDMQLMNDSWRFRAWLEFFEDGKFGRAFDEFAKKTTRGKRKGDELSAGVRYAIRRRLQALKDEAVQELIDAGIAVEHKVAQAAKNIIKGQVDTLTDHNMRVLRHTAEEFAEAQRWLDQTGGWRLKYVATEGLDFGTPFGQKKYENLQVPNEVARAINSAAQAGGFDPSRMLRLFNDPTKGDLKGIGRLISGITNAWKTIHLVGFMVPNAAYHMTQLLDIPFTIHRNQGLEGVFGTFAAAAENAGVVSRVTMSLTSWTDIIGSAERGLERVSGRRWRLALFDRQRYPAPKPTRASEAYVVAPDGTVYTWDQLARYAHDNGLEASRARAELARDLVDDMRRRQSGTHAALVKGALVAWQRGLQELSHTFEVAARVGVMVDAVKKGKSLPDAVADARAALLDYGRLTKHEQSWLRLCVPFWSFLKANQVSFMRVAAKHPERIRQQLQGIQATWDLAGISDEERANWNEYQTGRIALATLTEDGAVWRKDGRLDPRHRALGLFSPSFSSPQGLSIMFDVANVIQAVPLMMGLLKAKPGAGPESPGESAEELILENLNPVARSIAKAYKFANNKDPQTGKIQRELIVSPTLMSMPGFGEFVKTHFPVKKNYYNPDAERFLRVEDYIVPEYEKLSLPVVYTVEGPAAQAAYILFMDMFASELARPAAFLDYLGQFDSQIEYTRRDRLSAENPGTQLFQYMPAVKEEKIKTARRVGLELREQRMRELRAKIPAKTDIPN